MAILLKETADIEEATHFFDGDELSRFDDDNKLTDNVHHVKPLVLPTLNDMLSKKSDKKKEKGRQGFG